MSYEIYQLGKCIDCSSDPEEIKKRWDELRLSEHYSGERVVIQPFEIQEDDTLRHTLEWSRIQERLKRADELDAELERVKDEREIYRLCLTEAGVVHDGIEMDEFAARLLGETIKLQGKQLTSLKSRLPKNADGDVIIAGEKQYYSLKGVIKEFDVRGIHPNGVVSNGKEFLLNKDCHSTAESCRAAAEGGVE